MSSKDPAEKAIRDIHRKTRRKYSVEEKICIVLEGLRGEESIAAVPLAYPTALGVHQANDKQ